MYYKSDKDLIKLTITYQQNPLHLLLLQSFGIQLSICPTAMWQKGRSVRKEHNTVIPFHFLERMKNRNENTCPSENCS